MEQILEKKNFKTCPEYLQVKRILYHHLRGSLLPNLYIYRQLVRCDHRHCRGGLRIYGAHRR